MYHLSRTGKRARCRAIIKPCPLGGEAPLFQETGIQGAPRPTVDEARQAGMYEVFYGQAVKERAEKKAEKAANTAVIDRVEQHIDTREYKEKLAAVREEIEHFNDKYENFLSEKTHGNYYLARQKLSPEEQQYVNDLDQLGSSVSALVQLKASQKADEFGQVDERWNKMKSMEAEYRTVRTAASNEISEALRQYIAGEITEEEYGERCEEIETRRDEAISGHRDAIATMRKEHKAAYTETYGQAYKEALKDLGVEFSDGYTSYEEIVKNADTVPADFADEMKQAISYYPAQWVNNVDCNLKIHKQYGVRGRTVGRVVSYENGYTYEKRGREINLYSSDFATSVHEFGHVLEKNNRELGRAERLFLISEKKHSSSKKVLKDGSILMATDSMIRPYSGAYYSGGQSRTDTYKGNTYEVLTTGVENLFVADQDGFTADDSGKAPRHRNFILGLFATAIGK